MKNILIVSLLIISIQTLGYRYLKSTNIGLPVQPQHINYLQSDLLVTQTDDQIVVWNLTTLQVVQSFTSDTDTPDVQIAG